MKHCDHCRIDVTGDRERCPLCDSSLKGEATPEVFPVIPTIYRQFHFLFKVMIFISVAVSVIAVAVNLILEETGLWSHFVVLGILCVWISMALAIRKRKNIPKNMLYQVMLLSIICVLWDLLIGWRGWSINYVVPILYSSAMIALAILSKIFNWAIENIIVYFCIDALFGITPLILVLTGLATIRIPSVICVAGSLISVAAIIVFKGDSIWAELKRRLYI